MIAVGFSLLLLAHVLAFTARMLALWRVLRSKAPVEVQHVWPARRVFLRSLLGAAAVAFLPAVLGQQVARAQFVQSSELFRVCYGPCNCSGTPGLPRANCPNCKCNAGDPPSPTLPCGKANLDQETMTESAGTCVGTLKDCDAKCTRRNTYRCSQLFDQFSWNLVGTQDSCPKPDKRDKTHAKGECQGVGCKKPGAECLTTQEWRCERDTDGTWERAGLPQSNCEAK